MFKRFTGELQDRQSELDFLAQAWPRQRWQLMIVVGVCCLGVVAVTLANLADDRVASELPGLLAARLVQLAVMVYAWSLTWRVSRPAHISGATGLAELVTVVAEGVNFSLAFELMERADAPGTPFMVLLLFVFYTLIPIRFIYTIGVGVVATISTCLLVSYHYNASFAEISYIAAMFLFVNLLGIGYGGYINRLQRQDFISRSALEREIGQRKQAEQQALESKEMAERASGEKSRFIAVAGHDLRQPLHALGLWVDNLQQQLGIGDLDAAQTLVSRVVTAKEGLTDLMDRLLHVAHLEAGVTDIDLQPVAVRRLFIDIEKANTKYAGKRGIRTRFVDSSLVVKSDPLLLQRILDNLVDNALKYGAHGGRLTMGVRRRGKNAVFQVWNTGDGIPQDQMSQIFEEFHQVDRPGARDVRGLGLGLSIVRRLSGLLDHTIDVHSVPGKLTCFSVTVPLSTEKAVPQPTEPATTFDLRPLLVLVIDDDSEITDAIGLLLSRWGHETRLCNSDVEAIEKTRGWHPELIITDYQLSDTVNGIDLVNRLFSEQQFTSPVILMSGDTTAHGLQRADASGFTVLNKPVKPTRLRMVISRLVGKEAAA